MINRDLSEVQVADLQLLFTLYLVYTIVTAGVMKDVVSFHASASTLKSIQHTQPGVEKRLSAQCSEILLDIPIPPPLPPPQ